MKRYIEPLVWLFIWGTHWMGWHETIKLAPGDKGVWCIDCLRFKRK